MLEQRPDMIGRRVAERVRQHAWFAVAIDLLVVIVGILMALQLDGWAQRREERGVEQVYLQRLVEDLQIEGSRMEAAERYANARIEAARLLGSLVDNPSIAMQQPARVPWAIETASWRSFPQINAFVYRELQSTGRLALIHSEQLRRSLAEHYTALQHDARVGEDLSTQQRFDAATAGLLTIDELEAVERVSGQYEQLTMAPERALAVARSFAQRPAAIAELPGLVQHHTFNLRVIALMRERANQIIQQIDSLTSTSRTTNSIFGALLASSSSPQCAGAATAPALDHAILVVSDLDQAPSAFRKQGFRLKQGRLHANNLLNRHVKFRDGSSIELMTVQGEPGDAMAQDYADLIAAGEGGVYVSLKVPDVAVTQRSARELQLETRLSASGPWRFVSFPPSSPAAAVFFSSGRANVPDPDSLVSHQPDVVGLREAWVEGGPELGEMLERIGAQHCGTARSPDSRVGDRWALSRGSLVIVAPNPLQRPRVLGVVVQRRTPGTSTVYPHPRFWVHYQFTEENYETQPDDRGNADRQQRHHYSRARAVNDTAHRTRRRSDPTGPRCSRAVRAEAGGMGEIRT